MKHKTALICISDTYLARGRQLRSFYLDEGDEVIVLTPDFSHRTKALIETEEEGVKLLEHRPYTKNLSWQRLLGHMEFAKRCREYLEEWQPDRIHCMVPANSLCREMALYKREHPEVVLFFDINDTWPESLPVGSWFQHLPPAWLWKGLRNRYLPEADHLFCECEHFRKMIQEQTGIDSSVVNWASSNPTLAASPRLTDRSVTLCYLGFVNNIIDLDWMEHFFEELDKTHDITLHLIAQGQRKDEMVERLGAHCTIIDHGAVYDPQKKQDIFDSCAFGLNIMKPSVEAGLSMKTVDYLQGGLPVINSLRGDVHDWIEKDGCGINIDREDPARTAAAIAECTYEDLMHMRKAARSVFNDYLSVEAFEQAMDAGLAAYERSRSHRAQ